MDLVHTNCYLVSFSPYYHRRNLEADVFVYPKKKTQLPCWPTFLIPCSLSIQTLSHNAVAHACLTPLFSKLYSPSCSVLFLNYLS